MHYHSAMSERTRDLTDPRGSGRPAREIRSEARGPHWVAWVVDANGKPEGSVVLVGETRQQAEERAKEWAEQASQR
jgi:hypothetical protein